MPSRLIACGRDQPVARAGAGAARRRRCRRAAPAGRRRRCAPAPAHAADLVDALEPAPGSARAPSSVRSGGAERRGRGTRCRGRRPRPRCRRTSRGRSPRPRWARWSVAVRRRAGRSRLNATEGRRRRTGCAAGWMGPMPLDLAADVVTLTADLVRHRVGEPATSRRIADAVEAALRGARPPRGAAASATPWSPAPTSAAPSGW